MLPCKPNCVPAAPRWSVYRRTPVLGRVKEEAGMPRRPPPGDPRHYAEDIHRLQDEVAALRAILKTGSVVTFLGQVNLELRKLAAEWVPDSLPDGAGFPLCATCDCPMVLGGEDVVCRVCAKFDWLAH